MKEIAARVTRRGSFAIRPSQFAAIQFMAPSARHGGAPGGMCRDADEIERGISESARGSHGDRGLIVTASGLAIIHRQLIVALAASCGADMFCVAKCCCRGRNDFPKKRFFVMAITSFR
jgi:hypothetical protein